MLTISPSDVVVSFGANTLAGFIDGEFISIKRETQPFSYSRSMDGSMAVAVNRHSSYTVELTFAQSSSANDFLHLVQNVLMKSLGKQSGSNLLEIGKGILNKLPLIIRDKRGSTMFFAMNVFFDEEPEVTYSNGMESRKWVLRCCDVQYIIGGNDEGLSTDLNKLNAIINAGKSFLG